MPKPVSRTPLHPGEILREQFMADFGVSSNRLARDLRVRLPESARLSMNGVPLLRTPLFAWRAISVRPRNFG
jgi:hypothetical protein